MLRGGSDGPPSEYKDGGVLELGCRPGEAINVDDERLRAFANVVGIYSQAMLEVNRTSEGSRY